MIGIEFEAIKSTLMDSLTTNQFFTGGAMLGAIGIGVRYAQRLPRTLWAFFSRQMFYTLHLDSSDPSFYALLNCLKEVDFDKHFRNNDLKFRNDSDGNPRVFIQPTNDWRFGKIFDEWCIVSIQKADLKGSGNDKGSSTWIKGYMYPVHPDAFINKYELTFFTPWSFNRVKEKFEQLHNYFPSAPDYDNTESKIMAMDRGGWWRETDSKARKIDSVFLPKSKKEAIVKFFEKFYESRAWYEERGIPYRRGLLLHGQPGNGKSSIASAIARHFKKPLYYLNLSSIKSDSELLDYMRPEKPGIILMEDVDCVSASSVRGDDKEVYDGVTLSGLLNAIDGAMAQEGSVVVMTTNHPEKLDPALVRPGRIDLSVMIGNGTSEQLIEAFNKFFPGNVHLAQKFAMKAGDGVWPMCAIQNHLTFHSEDPEEAAKAEIGVFSSREF